jgi:hypothetical protein
MCEGKHRLAQQRVQASVSLHIYLYGAIFKLFLCKIIYIPSATARSRGVYALRLSKASTFSSK